MFTLNYIDMQYLNMPSENFNMKNENDLHRWGFIETSLDEAACYLLTFRWALWDQYIFRCLILKMLPDAILLITIYQNYQHTIAKDSIFEQSLHAANNGECWISTA